MIRAILTDIEGTTSSIRFVHDVLFPYAREHMAEFVRCNAEDAHVVPHLNDVRLAAGADLDLEGITRQLIAWIDADEKATPLKALQGMIWESGYRKGDFTGHIYPDAARQLRAWHEAGIPLYVFSSGSVQAQQLLFGYSDEGDLTPLFRAIAADIGLPPEDILFLSDVSEELDAARSAGMRTTWLVRDAVPDETAVHRQASSFDDIDPAALD